MTEARTTATAQQIVAFFLGNEEYGVPIIQVSEVIRKVGITRIPGMPDFIEGVINLRGKIIPVIDLRKRFGLPVQVDTEKTRIIVVLTSDHSIGLIVDGVSEVINLSNDQIEPIPPTIAAIDAEYLSGVGKRDTQLTILIHLEKLLNDIEKHAIEKLAKKGTVDTADAAQ